MKLKQKIFGKLGLSGSAIGSGVLMMVATAFAATSMVSCKDDDLGISGENSEGILNDGDGMYLGVTVSLSGSQGTRAESEISDASVDEYDNYINKSSMRVFVFGANGDFLFESTNADKTPTPDNTGQYYVKIPLDNSITDASGKSVLGLVRTRLEREMFKIAVLANWPGWPAEEEWTWANSALNVNANPADVKNVNDLHHLKDDGSYSKSNVYDFIMDSKKSGLTKSWVDRFQINGVNISKSTADTYIREEWDPSKTYQEGEFFYRYPKLWQVWNIGGSYDDNALGYEEYKWTNSKNDQEANWKSRNGDTFNTWLGNPPTSGVLGDVLTSNSQSQDGRYYVDGFLLDTYYEGKTNSDGSIISKQNGGATYAFHNGGYHGIALGRTNFTIDDTNQPDQEILNLSSNYNAGYIKITAPASGTLRIIWSSNNNSAAIFKLQRGTNYLHQPSNNATSTAPQEYTREITITQDPEDIYIYNTSNNPVVIYAVEYICNSYLYDTTRKGRIDQAIPMYGIQNFGPITNWGAVETLDLSQTGRYIDLIRSVAKVEVYMPKDRDIFYIGMRSMNSSSRCEPMDVENPTIQGWQKFTGSGAHDADYYPIHDADHCEWFDLINYGPGYKSGATTYSTWLSWFYGSWNKKLDGYGEEITDASRYWQWNFTGVTLAEEKNGAKYPHIFNPFINRTDFCEFVKVDDEVSGMDKYILYVPDKNIDDPNTVGDLASTPKVMHIEYRFFKDGEEKRDQYLDDNQCYRIYFTDYDTNSEIKKVTATEFDAYELIGLENNEFWPVMRNHIYRFYVNGTAENQEVYVKVNEWDTSPAPQKEVW